MIYRSVYRNARGWAWTRDCLLSKPDNIGCAVQLWFFLGRFFKQQQNGCSRVLFSFSPLTSSQPCWLQSSRARALPRPDNYLFVDPFILLPAAAAPHRYLYVVRQRTQLETIQFHSICSVLFFKMVANREMGDGCCFSFTTGTKKSLLLVRVFYQLACIN